MDQSMSIRAGKHKEITKISQILEDCKRSLEAEGIYQWNNLYPNEQYFKEKVSAGELFVVIEENEVVGAFVLDECQPTEWIHASWRSDQGRYLVLHSLFIHPNQQNRGHAKAVLAFMEHLATVRNYTGIRLDVFAKNPIALRFYQKHGFVKTGEVTFSSKPVNNQVYYCYDKLLV